MKKLCAWFVLAVLFSFASYAEDRIAVVDIKRVESESTAAQKVKKYIKKKRDAYQADITKQEEELRDSDQKLAKQRSILSPEAFEAKRKENKNKFQKLQRDLQDKRTKLATAHVKAMNEIQKEVLKIVVELSKDKEKGYDLALPSSQILFAKKNLDITDKVIKKLNKNLPKVNVKIK